MIRILTKTKHAAFNMASYEQELDLARVLSYHVKNKTGKKLRVRIYMDGKPWRRYMIHTSDIRELTIENRVYDYTVDNAIDTLINSIEGGESHAHS